jgi:transcriptional regulator with XRE-family HTH domain
VAEGAPLYPNELRNRRHEVSLSRAQLAALTERAAAEDSVLYGSVSARSLERLERGEVRPQARSAQALAKALGTPVPELFPLGVSDQAQNPAGNTRVAENRPPRGKGKRR